MNSCSRCECWAFWKFFSFKPLVYKSSLVSPQYAYELFANPKIKNKKQLHLT